MRAVLERVAATHQALVCRVTGDGTSARLPRSVVATGGCARSPLWLQINADMLGLPVVLPACVERACLGAAAFAAVAAGCHATISDATDAMVRLERVFEASPSATALYRDLAAESISESR